MICDYIYFNYVYENLLKTVSKLRYDDWYILWSIVREKKKKKETIDYEWKKILIR